MMDEVVSPWGRRVELWGPRAVAAELGIAPAQGDRVVHSGIAGRTYATTAGTLVEARRVQELAERPLRTRDELPPALVLRVNAPSQEGDRWTGWHAGMTEAEVREATLRWWPVANARELVGNLVVASVAGIPAWVGRLVDVEKGFGRVALIANLAAKDDSEAQVYLESRLSLQRGPLIDRIGI